MAKRHLVAALDLGTQNIKILVAEKKENGELEAVWQLQEPAFGVRRGVVISPQDISLSLRKFFNQAQQEIGQRIDSVYVNVDGGHLFASSSRGSISVSRADRRISEEDVQRVLREAQAISLPSNKEIFDAATQEFIIDGQPGIKEAAGLEGVKLEAEVLVLGGFAPYLKNLKQTILDSELQALDIVPSPLAAARSCLTPKQKELGCAIVDIGAGTTGLAIFEEGNLIHMAILPMGSGNITNDIAIGLKTETDVAEKIKTEYGSCLNIKKQKLEKFDIGEENPLVFSHKQLTEIILPRVEQIFCEIAKELKKISKEKSLPSGIVFTGGGAKLPGLVEFAKKEFKLPVRLGKPQDILNLDDSSWSVCSGLALLAADAEGPSEGSEIIDKFTSKIKKIFKALIP